tara:strand:+ start:35 stop:163 length:129 start_codon:yes stop_codon:yes gene_type:complete
MRIYDEHVDRCVFDEEIITDTDENVNIGYLTLCFLEVKKVKK